MRHSSFGELVSSGELTIGDGYRAKNDELGGSGPIFLRAAYLQDEGFRFSEPDRFKRLDLPTFGDKVSQVDDTVITTKGNSLGRTGIIREQQVGAIYSPHLSYWRSKNPSALDPGFLYYWSRSPEFRSQCVAMAHSTDMAPYLSLRDQLRLRITLPEPEHQRWVARFLGPLDDKIELNRRMNGTLGALARALFKSWFVDFDPVRAKAEGRKPFGMDDATAALFPARFGPDGLPEGWEERSIYDFVEVVYGAPFSSKRFNRDGRGLPLIRIRDLSTHEPLVFTDEHHQNGHVIEPGDIVVGMDGEFRRHIWRGVRAWLNQRVCHFEPLDDISKSFVAEAIIEPLSYFERGKVGTTVIHLGKSDIDTFKLIWAGRDVVHAFGLSAEPLRERIIANALESRTLALLRDLLLPKLMSGELRFGGAEQSVEDNF